MEFIIYEYEFTNTSNRTETNCIVICNNKWFWKYLDRNGNLKRDVTVFYSLESVEKSLHRYCIQSGDFDLAFERK